FRPSTSLLHDVLKTQTPGMSRASADAAGPRPKIAKTTPCKVEWGRIAAVELNQLSQLDRCDTGIPPTIPNPQEPAMTDFDPAQHRMMPEQRWFEDFVLGERFVIPSRTQSSAVFAAFQTASGDTHPIHYDVEYCRARGMPDLLAHGFQTLVHTAPGAGLF